MSMAYYVDLTANIANLPNYAKIKQISDLVNAILRGSIEFGYGRKEWTLGKTNISALYFVLTNLEGINTLKTLNFFDVENKKQDRGLKFLATNQNSPIKSYTVKLSDDLKFLTRFLNDINKCFMDE